MFVVARIEEADDLDAAALEQRISLTKAFWSKEQAEAEVRRLNEINRTKGCRYACYPARLPLRNLSELELNQYAEEILQELESKFGKRDPGFIFEGVHFSPVSTPATFFPVSYDSKRVLVQLTESARKHPYQALFQLANACVHLLDPVLGGQTSVLEEGIAAGFQDEYASRFDRTYPGNRDPRWLEASFLADQLLLNAPNAIRNLRAKGLRISEFTPDDLRSEWPQIDLRLAIALTQKFK